MLGSEKVGNHRQGRDYQDKNLNQHSKRPFSSLGKRVGRWGVAALKGNQGQILGHKKFHVLGGSCHPSVPRDRKPSLNPIETFGCGHEGGPWFRGGGVGAGWEYVGTPGVKQKGETSVQDTCNQD